MLDFKTFKQLTGMLQMLEKDEQRDKHIQEMYNKYLEDKDFRTNIDQHLKSKLKVVSHNIDKFMREK